MKQRLLALLLLPILPACAPEERFPDIVLVTIDTLRADHLGCHGYHRDTSPTIDALAREGLRFDFAISTMATTLPVHLSLFTGLYPHQHGYLTNAGAAEARYRPTPGRRPVALVLKERGYDTAAFVSGPTVTRATGIDAGFDHFDEHETTDFSDVQDLSRRAEVTIDRALAWLRQERRKPIFLWVHLWDPHEPNTPLEPWASMFPSDEGLERLIDERRIDPAVLRERFSEIELARMFAPGRIADLRAGRPVEMPAIDREAVRDMINRYDACVRYADDQLGRLFGGLRELGRWEEAVLVVTSDHGQALGQRDWLEHGRIELENTHVPLVMRFPPGLVDQPGRVHRVVSLVDVFPTVFGRIGPAPFREYLAQGEGEDQLAGRVERTWAFSQRSERRRAWEADPARSGSQLALTLPSWRYYHRPDGPDELYDLRDDPGELVDRLAEEPEVALRLRRILVGAHQSRPYQPQGGDEDERTRQYRDSLKNTGYAGDQD